METQIKSFYHTPQGLKFVTIFGYSSRALPSLEINGVGKLSRNIKEKLIYVTRTRRLSIPQRRFVICVELNELEESQSQSLKWLEFPLLLMYWHLSGLIPIAKLDDCIASGFIKSKGEIVHLNIPQNFSHLVYEEFKDQEIDDLKIIGTPNMDHPFWTIDSKLLLEHIPDLEFISN